MILNLFRFIPSDAAKIRHFPGLLFKQKPSNTGACSAARFPHNINLKTRPALP